MAWYIRENLPAKIYQNACDHVLYGNINIEFWRREENLGSTSGQGSAEAKMTSRV